MTADRDDDTRVLETHLSRIFLTPDRAYKQLKPVTTSFVDLAPTDDRLQAASREYELNSRISPDVYLGTAEVEECGELTDRFIVMRRLPASCQLDRLLGQADFDDHVREVARYIAAVHAGVPPERGPAASGATREALAANWSDALTTVEPLVGQLVAPWQYELTRRLVDRYLIGRGPLFESRIEQGWIRDGHGDLRAEHIFLLDDGPRLIDCLAFRDDLRIGDVLLDVAFLVMDLHRLVGPASALGLVRHYDEFAAERHPSSLAHHYVAYRAWVRAKVAAIRHAQGSEGAGAEVVQYHRLALEHLLVGQTRLVLVGGGAGVGKSTVASGLADAVGAVWLRADAIRKNMAGMASTEHAFAEADQGIYSPEFSDAVYREMLREAELLLQQGESVVLDATWSAAHRRGWARDLAERTASTLTELECQVPLDVARERIARRLASLDEPSDASPDIADHIAAGFEPWTEATAVDTNREVPRSVESACRTVMEDTGLDDGGVARLRRADAIEAQLADLMRANEAIEFFLSRIASWHRQVAATPWPGPTGRSV